MRRQLAFVGAPVATSVAALAIGLIGWRSPTPSVLTACLVPLASWAIVHCQFLATHSALSWHARRSHDTDALPAELAAAIGGSLSDRRVLIWALRDGRLHAVGVWPDRGEAIAPTTEAGMDVKFPPVRRPNVRDGMATGMVTVDRHDPVSRHDEQFLEGDGAQAALVIEHLALATTLSGQRVSGGLDHLTSREREVLGLMAKAINAAICDELHLSIKTVEPAIGSIFTKLGLHSRAAARDRSNAASASEDRGVCRQLPGAAGVLRGPDCSRPWVCTSPGTPTSAKFWSRLNHRGCWSDRGGGDLRPNFTRFSHGRVGVAA